MKTENLIPPLRDLPPGRMARRRQHLLAEITPVPNASSSRLPRFVSNRIAGPAAAKPPVWGRRRAVLGLGLAAAVSIVAATLILGGTAGSGGAARQNVKGVRAASVNDLIAQVQNAFGSGAIASASVNGSIVTAQATTSDRSSQAVSFFAAAVLGHAIADWQAAHGQTPVTDFRPLDSSGQSLTGAPMNAIGNDSSASPLSSGTCEQAGQNVSASVSVVSAQTFPFAGGTCVFKVTSTPANAVAAVGEVSDAMANVLPSGATNNNYPHLIEVNDASGTPLVVLAWIPGIGRGGAGTVYVEPGLPQGSTLSQGF